MNGLIILIYCALFLIVGRVTSTVCQSIHIPPTIGGIIVIAVMALAIYYLDKIKAKINKRKG